HGTVRDAEGRKMSKSLGNGIDPLEVVERFGADAMRYTIVSQCAVGTDIVLDHRDVEGTFANGRNVANKIWNAGRFALSSIGDAPVAPILWSEGRPHVVLGGENGEAPLRRDLEVEDRWILSRVATAASSATRALERFRLHEAAEGLYHFFWGELCDWYLELVKPRLGADAEPGSREAARATLVVALDHALRLLHPIVPFVTAELWARLPWPAGRSRPADLIVAPWPAGDAAWDDPTAERQIRALQERIVEVRRLRKEYGVPEGERVRVHVRGGPPGFADGLAQQGPALLRLARVEEVGDDPAAGGAGAHAVLPNGAELFLPLEGVIDVAH